MRRWFVLVLLTPGCAHHPRVQNPFPGVFRVAVIPFNDKTAGAEGLDTMEITRQLTSELQQVPSFEVVPLREVQEVLGSTRIETNQPQHAYALARAVHAQAVIVGDVTEYSAYYPPRLGLHCELYAMVTGEPEIVVAAPPPQTGRERAAGRRKVFWECCSPVLGGLLGLDRVKKCDECGGDALLCVHKRETRRSGSQGRVPGAVAIDAATVRQMSATQFGPSQLERNGIRADAIADNASPRDGPVLDSLDEDDLRHGRVPEYRTVVRRLDNPVPIVEPWVIRHSRVFDGANVGLVRKLQDYHFFRHDARGGDWGGYLERSNDFTRFACNRMIYEMLDAAGGAWTPLRGLRIPQPWQPWPPR